MISRHAVNLIMTKTHLWWVLASLHRSDKKIYMCRSEICSYCTSCTCSFTFMHKQTHTLTYIYLYTLNIKLIIMPHSSDMSGDSFCYWLVVVFFPALLQLTAGLIGEDTDTYHTVYYRGSLHLVKDVRPQHSNYKKQDNSIKNSVFLCAIKSDMEGNPFIQNDFIMFDGLFCFLFHMKRPLVVWMLHNIDYCCHLAAFFLGIIRVVRHILCPLILICCLLL